MADEEDSANVFAIPDFYKTSRWLKDPNQNVAVSFFTANLKDCASTLLKASPLKVQDDTFFRLPSIKPLAADAERGEDENVNENANEESEEAVQYSEDMEMNATESISGTEVTNDFWMELDRKPEQKPEYRTWEDFINGTSGTDQPPLITEAGPAVYDALLKWTADPLELNSVQVPVVEAKPYFSSLLALSLGRESILFRRDDKNQTFRSALPELRISGYSRDILQGLEKQCFACGSIILQLRSFIKITYSKQSTQCGVALASALEQILRVVQHHAAVNGRDPQSLLQVQLTVKGLLAILEPFHKLTLKLGRGYSDEDVLSVVFHQASSVDYGEEQLREIMQEVLRRVSRPWTEFLEEWIGTKSEEGLPFTKANVGERKGFVKVQLETYTDDFGQEAEEVGFCLDEEKLPYFMPDDIAKSIFEAGKNLRFIRQYHPQHPLARPDTITRVKPPRMEWLYEWDAIQQLEGRVAEYRNNLLNAIRQTRVGAREEPVSEAPRSFFSNIGHDLQPFGAEGQQIEDRITASMNWLDQPVSDKSTEDSLGQIVRRRLSNSYQLLNSNSYFAPHWSLLPVLSFGGITSAQSQVINQESLKLLFSAHSLRAHLKMHRSFHLFGNGMFSIRLAHALFDPDLETAERHVGVARQGGVMGLRLGGRETWPPASSELRLALMGVLAETFEQDDDLPHKKLQKISRDSSELPGDMSFAVRDLTQEEINKCMNPDSLEALDFLRLSYKAPDALAPIITPVILMQYDRIFKLLLRILRMVYVVDQLFRDVNGRTSRWEDPGDTSYRFSREAHHFVHGVASYFIDTGVAIPWQAFEKKLDAIEKNLNSSDANKSGKVESPDRLRDFYSLVLERIMLALFLRKRQQPVLKLLEEIFNLVLQYAKHSRMHALGKMRDDGTGREVADLYKRFKKKVQIFVTVCRGLTEKGRSGSKRTDDELGLKQDGIGEDNMLAQLLMKLDMCEYYNKH